VNHAPNFEHSGCTPAHTPPVHDPQSTIRPESWQHAFFAAVTETNRSKALPLIRDAQTILETCVADITCDSPGNTAELLDLWNSLTYLGILLECMGNEPGGFLWD
jgi:hypothetical protein